MTASEFKTLAEQQGLNFQQLNPDKGAGEIWRLRRKATDQIFVDYWPYSTMQTVYCQLTKQKQQFAEPAKAIEFAKRILASGIGAGSK